MLHISRWWIQRFPFALCWLSNNKMPHFCTLYGLLLEENNQFSAAFFLTSSPQTKLQVLAVLSGWKRNLHRTSRTGSLVFKDCDCKWNRWMKSDNKCSPCLTFVHRRQTVLHKKKLKNGNLRTLLKQRFVRRGIDRTDWPDIESSGYKWSSLPSELLEMVMVLQQVFNVSLLWCTFIRQIDNQIMLPIMW